MNFYSSSNRTIWLNLWIQLSHQTFFWTYVACPNCTRLQFVGISYEYGIKVLTFWIVILFQFNELEFFKTSIQMLDWNLVQSFIQILETKVFIDMKNLSFIRLYFNFQKYLNFHFPYFNFVDVEFFSMSSYDPKSSFIKSMSSYEHFHSPIVSIFQKIFKNLLKDIPR